MTLTIMACGSETESPVDTDSGVETEDAAMEDAGVPELAEEGDIGLYVNIRRIQFIGQEIDRVRVKFAAPFASLNEILDVDARLGGVSLVVPRETLDEELLAALDAPVMVSIEALDSSQGVLASELLAVDLKALSEIELGPQSPAAQIEVEFENNTEIGYLVQNLNDGQFLGYATETQDAGASSDSEARIRLTQVPSGAYILTFSDGTRSSILKHSSFIEFDFLFWDENIKASENPQTQSEYHFQITGFLDGSVVLRSSVNGRALFWETATRTLRTVPEHDPALERFRLLAGNLTWDVESEAPMFLEPAIPQGHIDTAWSSNVENCANTQYVETVGQVETRTTTRTISTEESFELFSSETASVNVTAGVTAGFNAFGASVQASLEVSAGYEYTTSSTSTGSSGFSKSEEEVVEISREREITIPPYTSVEIQDQVHVIDNFKVPYVQTFMISASVGTDALPGSAIATQLRANGFSGVIHQVLADSVEASIRGNMTVDRIYETSTSLIEGECL